MLCPTNFGSFVPIAAERSAAQLVRAARQCRHITAAVADDTAARMTAALR